MYSVTSINDGSSGAAFLTEDICWVLVRTARPDTRVLSSKNTASDNGPGRMRRSDSMLLNQGNIRFV